MKGSPILLLVLLSLVVSAALAQDAPAPAAPAPRWFEKTDLSGFLAGEGRWRRTGAGAAAAITTDLYLRAFELSIEADVIDWLSATIVINSEYVGDPLNAGDSTVVVDEAHLDISVPRTPIYFVLGKRIQPFGLFESYLVTDLLVQDGYETKAVGLTAGIKAPGSTDLSITAYKGHIRSDHMTQSGLLGPEAPDFPEAAAARVDSWIISVLSSPTGDDWRISAGLASEPGEAGRLTTLNIGSYLSFPFYENLEFNAEYMKALRRDLLPAAGRSFLESTLSVTAAYLLVPQEMKDQAGRNYRARKSRRLAHPAVLAVRFEALKDDGRAEALGTWSVKHRLAAGGRYTFYERGNVEAALGFEYRRQAVRISPAFTGAATSANEFYLRFGLDF
ncbi:MAG TPA: hypothetical protein VLJ16_04945 [Acidobacteriota bacterium]|nr:hypothetical protein [Acidobacteriota bacterium]